MLADDSHVMSSLFFSENLSSAVGVIGMLRGSIQNSIALDIRGVHSARFSMS